MVKELKWCVLGGWAIEPDVLKPIFGDISTYIDINPIMNKIITKGRVCNNWRDICTKEILSFTNSTEFIVGWSTGAIIAMGCILQLRPRALVLLSATPSFCRNSIFKHGIKPIVLQKMREKLIETPEEVISDFIKKCGFKEKEKLNIQWTKEELLCGLYFLEQITILEEQLCCNPLFIHGTNDEIVPFSAGEFLHKKYGGSFLTLNAPHACFLNNEREITETLEKYLKGLQI
ncbi:MAG: hypothetical protein N2053_08665 [Chitinispirillaceae bacterium]|nr:hypothetical protein [Chitinispirillaceae bacterium]